MAALVRCQVVIPKDNGIPADAITNTFHFHAELANDGGPQAEDLVVDALDEFYNDVVANNVSVGLLMSKNLNGAAARVKTYSLDDGEPVGPPIGDDPLPINLSTGDALADQLAICLSYQAVPAAGIKQSRRRGRIFIGPLSVGVQAMSGGWVHIDPFASQLIADAGARLVHHDTNGLQWVVFSAKDYTDSNGVVHHKKPPQPQDAFYTVDNCWVDDRFDIQRGRAQKSVSRSVAD